MSTRFTGCTRNLWPFPSPGPSGRKPPSLVESGRFQQKRQDRSKTACSTHLKTLDLGLGAPARFGTLLAFLCW